MKKLTLNVDALRVESFEAGAGQPARGTVDAHAWAGALRTPICPSHHNTECCATDALLTNCC
jgi:glutamate mutase epsilon subunit